MTPAVDLGTLQFGQPQWLWLLIVPAVSLLLWLRYVLRRRRDVRQLTSTRIVPQREHFPLVGDALFWLTTIVATALLVVALAQPRVVTSTVRSSGADLVVVLDGSASMHVADVAGNRWGRSVAFLRVLGDHLSWRQDRVALALFAHVAVPQVRLTKDPNTLFFFLDHLNAGPPFRLEDATTWDTNIALGLRWGLRVIERDEQINGRSVNGRLLVLLSDGQAWTGEVAGSIRAARARGIPIFVVGVGTSRGGTIPDPIQANDTTGPIVSRLDRASLGAIATAGGGEYFELDRNGDEDIADRIIEAARRRAPLAAGTPVTQELYWQALAMAIAIAFAGVVFLRDRVELGMQLVAAACVAVVVVAALR